MWGCVQAPGGWLERTEESLVCDKSLGVCALNYASPTDLVYLMSHSDQSTVPEDSDGTEYRDGGTTQSAQVTSYPGDPKWLPPRILY